MDKEHIVQPKTIFLTVVLALSASVASTGMQNARPAHALTVARRAQTALSIATTVSRRTVRPGGTIAFTIKVTNGSETAAREVTICDRLPASVARVVHAGGLHLFDGTACQTMSALPAKTTASIRLVLAITRRARAGLDRNTALVFWEEDRASTSAIYRIVTEAHRCQTSRRGH
jgi:uncharacterized repeat protein (TIGR01451 family)